MTGADSAEYGLRRATTADGDALNRLAREAYAVYVPIVGRAPQPMATDWATLLDGQEIWLFEATDASLLGSLALVVEPDHLVIWSVAITPAAQHRGLGRRLMAFAERRARALGRGEVRLFTNTLMARNIAFYRRLGYAETHRENLPDRILVHMAKRLSAA